MKRAATLRTAILLAGCLVIALGWIGFISFLQSHVAIVRVSVAGSVDEVTIYSVSNPTQAVASVRTNGQEITSEIKLPAARKGFTLVQPLPEEYFWFRPVGISITGDLKYAVWTVSSRSIASSRSADYPTGK